MLLHGMMLSLPCLGGQSGLIACIVLISCVHGQARNFEDAMVWRWRQQGKSVRSLVRVVFAFVSLSVQCATIFNLAATYIFISCSVPFSTEKKGFLHTVLLRSMMCFSRHCFVGQMPAPALACLMWLSHGDESPCLCASLAHIYACATRICFLARATIK